jgi:hypothetical protein
LTPAILTSIDQGLIAQVTSSRASRVARMIGTYMGSHAAAVPGLPDYFYLMRIQNMINSGVLVMTKEADLLIQCDVRLA